MIRFALYPLALLLSMSSHADSFCERQKMDREFPAGIEGLYQVVGRRSVDGTPYFGTLQVEYGDDAYTLRRTVQGKTQAGRAWFERCGADRISGLAMEIGGEQGFCATGTDGDNYYRFTCRLSGKGKERRQGLEAWFQEP
ncbi:hypothetical protein [Pseudomonas sp. LRF_L74]|uniref:hypothetical protein n=1 Tax=Pseudomonas sp. LRF_L74 TaxID=3369422 RepID=UPI003F646705